jgi:2-methylisocitrate lyase-like PEP mutase family enzyme
VLAALAHRLRALHRPGDPLVLVNVWDAASARRVDAAGAAALGTSSAAIAAALGVADDNSMDPALAFDAVRRVADASPLPVTADLEAGYGLPAAELIERLLAAGSVGCNLEDSDHDRPGALVDADVFADRLADVRRAAQAAGVDVVINARIDVVLHTPTTDQRSLVAETLRRARRYLDAGADCAYPIGLVDVGALAELAQQLDGRVNGNVGPSTNVDAVAAAGVSRISVGPQAQRRVMEALGDYAAEVLGGRTRPT